ncbi:MAG: hypothetical protein CMI13_09330 [Oleibacter sp.]|nr:hypothetical protein [Thalassolituus sp.]
MVIWLSRMRLQPEFRKVSICTTVIYLWRFFDQKWQPIADAVNTQAYPDKISLKGRSRQWL